VALATQTRETPWSAAGVPGKSWLRSFKLRHPELTSRKSQGLELGRARGLCPTSVASLYYNLNELYTSFHYPPSHIWNCDESGVQAGRSGGATVLAKMGSRSMHSIEADQKEHLSVLSCINAEGGSIPNFYILKGTYFLKDYVKRCEENAVMAMQPNAWMTKWLFESWISHFIGSLKKGPGIDLNNRHLLILDGHNSHVTLEVVTLAMNSGLDIVSLPSHTSHALQPLDVSCFKPFKAAFRQIKDSWTLVNKGRKVEKQDLCEWTSQALQKALSSKNIKYGFRKTGIWPYNAAAVQTQMSPSQGFEEGQEGFMREGTEDSSASSEEGGGPDEDGLCPGNEFQSAGEGCTSLDQGPSSKHFSPPCFDGGPRCFDPGPCSLDLGPRSSDLGPRSSDMGATCSDLGASSSDMGRRWSDLGLLVDEGRSRHYYVDVPNPEESNYGVDEQHVSIDPTFRAQLQEESGRDISEFLVLPELIPAKKRTRQQPLLDYKKSMILTSTDYIAGLQQVLAQKEATVAAAKCKKEENEANKEQKKIEKEQLQKQKEERAEARVQKRREKDLERQQKVAAAGVGGRRRRGAAARAQDAAPAAAGEGLQAGAARSDVDNVGAARGASLGDLRGWSGASLEDLRGWSGVPLHSAGFEATSPHLTLPPHLTLQQGRVASPSMGAAAPTAFNLPLIQRMNTQGFYRPQAPSPTHPLFQPSPRYASELERERMPQRPSRWGGER
jgi:hypothetical protein